MNRCTDLQERIAQGEPLAASPSSDEQQHLLDCAACAAVAASYSRLDATLRGMRDEVPDGFADRVLARIARERDADPPPRPWLLLALTPVCALIAAGNVAWFVLSSLLPAAGLGSAP
jgi:anti-sigma factor RsiW